MLRVFGGTFNGWINCTGDTSAYREISGGRFKSWQFMTADALGKLWVGTSKDTYNVGLYVDDEGYLVVGGAVITEPGDKFEASTVDGTTWSSYLKYSSAKENGLYYTNAEMAIAKAGNGTVNVFTDEVDMTGVTSKVTLNIVDDLTVTFADGTTPAWSVASTEGAVSFTEIISGGVVTRTYTVG